MSCSMQAKLMSSRQSVSQLVSLARSLTLTYTSGKKFAKAGLSAKTTLFTPCTLHNSEARLLPLPDWKLPASKTVTSLLNWLAAVMVLRVPAWSFVVSCSATTKQGEEESAANLRFPNWETCSELLLPRVITQSARWLVTLWLLLHRYLVALTLPELALARSMLFGCCRVKWRLKRTTRDEELFVYYRSLFLNTLSFSVFASKNTNLQYTNLMKCSVGLAAINSKGKNKNDHG